MTPMQLAHEAESAYDSRDRERLHMTVGRLAAMATPPDLSRLTREQLQQRRGELRGQILDIDDRLRAMDAAGRQTVHLVAPMRPPPSLEPSD